MIEPLTLTASVIANLAFQKFLESGAGELGKKFTTDAIAAMDALREKLWQRLQGRSDKLDKALSQAKQGDRGALDTIAKNLTDQNFIICCCLITLILVMIKQKLIILSIHNS